MSAVYRIRPKARGDLAELLYRFNREGSLSTARRFRRAAEATFQRLADRPGLGVRYEADLPRLAELRVSSISRFRNYLVFYRPIAGGIEIVRVLHGARDLPSILAGEFAPEGDGDDEDEAERPPDPGGG